mgnify:CR=1 FL=1|jgi:hypothetical protein
MTIEKMNILVRMWIFEIKPNIENYLHKIMLENGI